MSGPDASVPSGVGAVGPRVPRRERPTVLVLADGSPAAHDALVWSLREAARRDGTVLAVGVLTPGHASAEVTALVAAELDRAEEATGVRGRSRTSVVDTVLLEALRSAARGADLVLVGARGKALLRRPAGRPRPRLVHRA
ncbi:MAG: UspA protein [Klenkia sp.]|nr:UspA protein [Klenkia sp.]